MGRISLATIPLFFLSVFSASPLHAANESVYSRYLVKQGEILYERGDFVAASHELTKALLLDPNNQDAQYFLRKIDAGLYVHPRVTSDEAVDLVQEISHYQDKVEDLKKISTYQEKLNRYLEEDLATKKQHIQELGQQLADVNTRLNATGPQIAALKNETVSLALEKENLRQVIQAKDQSVDSLKSRIVEAQKSAKEQALRDQELVLNAKKEVQSAHNELDHSQELLSKSEDDLRKERIEHGYKTNKLLMASYQLNNSSSQLQAKDQQILDLMRMVGALETKIAVLTSKGTSHGKLLSTRQDQPVHSQEQISFMKQQDQTITNLKDKLASARRQLMAMSKDGKIDQAALTVLREQLKDVRIDLRVKEARLQQTEEQFGYAKQRLDLTETKLEEKDQRIRYLEKQLSKAAEKPGDISLNYLK